MIQVPGTPVRLLMLALLLGSGSVGAAAPPGKLVVTILETINHGTAIVLQTPGNRTYVIDTGGAGTGYDNGRDKIAPFLAARGVTVIDGIAISHSHNDHCGGASWLIQNKTVKQFIDNGYEGRGMNDAYRAVRQQARDRGGVYIAAHAGDTLDWGPELTVEILSPPKEFLMQDSDPAVVSEHSVLNNNSLTIRVQYGGNVVLLPGDAYGTETNYMAAHYASKMKATVLCAPHHGFNSTPGYAQMVRPDVVVASCVAYYTGEVASPADKTDLIYKPVGSKVYASTWNGDVEVTMDGTNYTVATQRTKKLEVQLSSAAYSVTENGAQATITANRTGGATGIVTVNYATSNGTAAAGSDYTAKTGTITWADGDVVPKTFTVPITDDTAVEPGETILLALSAPTGGAALGTLSSAVLTIVDNDGAPSPGKLQFSASAYSVGEGSQVVVSVTRANGSSGAVKVSYATTNGTATGGLDYAAASGTLSWAAGDVAPKTFIVSSTNDSAAEGNETLNLVLSAPTGGATLGTPSTVVLTIVDNDGTPPPTPGKLQFSASAYTVNEGGPMVVSVTRTNGASGAVSVSYATTNGTAAAGSDYAAATGVLTWAAGDAATRTFTVTTTNDAAVEGNETLNLALNAPTGGATLGTPSTAVLTIVDNDVAPTPGKLQFSAAAHTVNEGSALVITVTRTNGTSGAVTVSYATSDGTATSAGDYAESSGTLTWAAGDAAAKSFTVSTINDSVVEGNETLSLDLSGPTGGASLGSPSSSVLTIMDDDVSPDADGDGLPDAWEITHFTNATSQNGAGDPDGDGFSNLAEFEAGTDPMDPASRPAGGGGSGGEGGGCGLTGLEGMLILAALAGFRGRLRHAAGRRSPWISAWMFAALAGCAASGTAEPADGAPAPAGKLVVNFLETKGHGLAIVLRTPGNRTYVIDTGNAGKDFDNGRDTIAPLLQAHGVKEIDAVAISHPHADHYGGAPWLIRNMTVKRFIDNGYEGRGQTDAYREIRKQARERGGEVVAAVAGDTLDWDNDLTVEVLSPPKEFLLQGSDPEKVSEHAVLNNNSLTLRIQHGANVFLFPGDAYGSESNYIAKNCKDKVKATVLCAPHHGFNSTPGYAQLVKPEVVVASCEASYGGQMKSPADNAEKIFKPVGAKVYATTWHGSVEIVSDGKGYTVKTDRVRETR